jgi:glucokinase
MILAGDIGGTNSRLAVFDDKLAKQHEQTYRNEGRATFTQIVREFLDSSTKVKIDRAAFGVAGPVKDGRATMTNLPWKLDEQELARDLSIAKVALINDLVAHAEGIELLKPDQLITIQPGEFVHGNRAVIAAGTGLGEAGIFWDARQRKYRPFPSEGGHADFAPRDGWQIKLLQFLQRKYPNASWERVLSGPGLRNIYDYWVTVERAKALPQADPKPKDISFAGLKGQDDACTYALEMFVAVYGAASANLALQLLATGGVYIGGGIALHIVELLKSRRFADAFLQTGPENLRAVLRKIPVHIVNFELNGLFGAANHARGL